MTGVGVGASIMPQHPCFWQIISVEESLTPFDVALKKKMADVRINAAKAKCATLKQLIPAGSCGNY